MECTKPRFEVTAMAAAGDYLACSDDKDGVYIMDTYTWTYVYVAMEGAVYAIEGVTDRLFACVMYTGKVWLMNTDGVQLIELSQGYMIRTVCASHTYLVMQDPDAEIIVLTTLTGKSQALSGDYRSHSVSSNGKLYTAHGDKLTFGIGPRIVTMTIQGELLEVSDRGIALTRCEEYFFGYETEPDLKQRFYCHAPGVDEVTLAKDYLVMSRGNELCIMHMLSGNVMVSMRAAGVIQTLVYHNHRVYVGHTNGFFVQNI